MKKIECRYCQKTKRDWFICNVCYMILRARGIKKMDIEEAKEKFKEYLEEKDEEN